MLAVFNKKTLRIALQQFKDLSFYISPLTSSSEFTPKYLNTIVK